MNQSSVRKRLGREWILTLLVFASVAGTAVAIEATGGLPSQLAHLYYVPVVASALALRPRVSLMIAAVAAVAVTPAVDVFRGLLGWQPYYEDAASWNLGPGGWLVRPLAFLAINILARRFVSMGLSRARGEVLANARGEELRVLSKIERMILAGAQESDSIHEIVRLVSELTDARVAGIVTRDLDGRYQTFWGYVRDPAGPRFLDQGHIPFGEGVSGWALATGTQSVSQNVSLDPRYREMGALARRAGYLSAAAVPITLDGEILAALTVGYPVPRDFSSEELASLRRIADQAAIAVANARQRDALKRLSLDTAIVLADLIESRDESTGGHCRRLVEYAAATADRLAVPAEQLEVVRLGAALHDVGKIAVPDSVLKKADKLTPEEFEIMKQHCYVGGEVARKVPFLSHAYPIIYHHHERYGGAGYPEGLIGDAIPLGARIVAVADAFDAMTSDRVYRKAMAWRQAATILEDGAGTQWDPEVVEAFLSSQSTAWRNAA